MTSYPVAQIATQQQQQTAGSAPVAQAVPQAQVVGVVNSGIPTVQAQYLPTGGQVLRGDQGYYDKVPRRIVCQFCNYEGTIPVTGTGTHLIALGTCLVGCIPCCLIPYCVDEFKDTQHVCPNCHRTVGARRIV